MIVMLSHKTKPNANGGKAHTVRLKYGNTTQYKTEKTKSPEPKTQNAREETAGVGRAFVNVFNYICQLSMNMLAACKYK